MHPTQIPPTDVTATPVQLSLTPAEVLRGAARYLELHGWHQGDYYATIADAEAPFPACCVTGALAMAAYGERVDSPFTNHHPERRTFARAVEFLGDHLDYQDSEHGEYESPVFTWNDSPDRTATEVITALNEAAHEWDRLHPGGAR